MRQKRIHQTIDASISHIGCKFSEALVGWNDGLQLNAGVVLGVAMTIGGGTRPRVEVLGQRKIFRRQNLSETTSVT